MKFFNLEINNINKKPKADYKIEIKSDKESLPKLAIKNTLQALAERDLETLIPIYQTILQRDTKLSSAISKRENQLLGLNYILECEDEKQKEFLDSFLRKNIESLTAKIFTSIVYGFCGIDVVWTNIDNKLIPDEFILFPQTSFILEKNTLLLKLDNSNRLNLNDDKYKFMQHIINSSEIVENALLYKVAYICLLKHLAISSNMNYFDALGVPPLIAKIDDDNVSDTLKQLNNLRSNSLGVFSKDSEIELLKGNGTQADFLSFISYCDNNISELVVGNVLSGGTSGSSGSFAQSKTHENRQKEILKSDARLISNVITTHLYNILELNFAIFKPFNFYFDTNDEGDELQSANTYKILFDMGVDVPIEHLEKIFNITGLKRTKEETKEKNNISLESNNKQTALPLDSIDAIEFNTSKETKEIEKIIEKLISECKSYEEVYDKLLEIYKDENFDAIEEALSNHIANATLLGKTNV